VLDVTGEVVTFVRETVKEWESLWKVRFLVVTCPVYEGRNLLFIEALYLSINC
jgi:hypothetical protein